MLKRIGELESIIEDTLDHDRVQELVGLYGKATEMFSQDETSEYMMFTVKTQSLLARPDIQAVLDSNRNVPLLEMALADSSRTQQPTSEKKSSVDQSLLSLEVHSKNGEGDKLNSEDKDQTKQAEVKTGFMFSEVDDDLDQEKEQEEDEPDEDYLKAAAYFKKDSEEQRDNVGKDSEKQNLNKEDGKMDLLEGERKDWMLEKEKKSLDEFDLLELGLFADQKDSPLEKNDQPQALFSDIELNENWTAGKISSKLKRRDKNGDNSEVKEQKKIQESETIPSTTPYKLKDIPNNFDELTDFELKKISSMTKSYNSYSKKSQGTPIRKDSFSDDENKFVIG